MSYLNFQLLKQKNLKPCDIYHLTGIKQLEKEVLENLPSEVKERFETLGLLTTIKGKPNEEDWSKVRLSKVGKKLSNDLSFEGSCDEETEILGNWLVNIYKQKSGGIIKNKKEIWRQIQWFKTITAINGNRLATLLQNFILDTYSETDGLTVKDFMEQNPRGVLSNMLDNVFFNPTSVFDKHKTLDKSPLYMYFENNQDYIEKMWEDKGL